MLEDTAQSETMIELIIRVTSRLRRWAMYVCGMDGTEEKCRSDFREQS